jgi:hypothetical protein
MHWRQILNFWTTEYYLGCSSYGLKFPESSSGSQVWMWGLSPSKAFHSSQDMWGPCDSETLAIDGLRASRIREFEQRTCMMGLAWWEDRIARSHRCIPQVRERGLRSARRLCTDAPLTGYPQSDRKATKVATSRVETSISSCKLAMCMGLPSCSHADTRWSTASISTPESHAEASLRSCDGGTRLRALRLSIHHEEPPHNTHAGAHWREAVCL